MSDWILLVVYLMVSAATYVGLLRVSSHDYGVDWFYVLWSLVAFVPFVGQVVLLVIWLVTRDWDALPSVCGWLRRLAGN